MARYWRRGYRRGEGAPRHRKKNRRLAIALTATAVIIAGAVAFIVTRGSSAGANDGISVQADHDLKKVIADLPKLGFAGNVPRSGASEVPQNCSQDSTGDVKRFLTQNPCKEYAVTMINLHQPGISTQAVISWVVMTTPSLTSQYKKLADGRHRGNPPGQPAHFNGRCYASGQNGDATWVAQVKPTRHIAVDRQILQAVAPVKLSASYLRVHCTG